MSNWREKAGFAAPSTVEHEVAGRRLRFWPISVGKAVKLRAIGGPLVKALVVVMGGALDQANDKVVRQVPDEHGMVATETVIQAVDPSVMSYRAQARGKAVEDAILALTEPESLQIVGEALLDSLRDLREELGDDCPPPREFVQALSPAELRQAITGLGKANAEVFGPFGKLAVKVFGKLGTLVDEGFTKELLEQAVSEAVEEVAEAAESIAE